MTASPSDFDIASEIHSLGAYRPIALSSILTFPERTTAVMIFEQMTRFITVSDTRFFERRFYWTGRGVMDPPQITGVINGHSVRLSRHGPLYRRGRFTAYLVDLGRVAPPGEVIEVCTRSKFVDESLDFMPYLALEVMPSVTDVVLAVRLADPVDDLKGTFTAPPVEASLLDAPSEALDVEIGQFDNSIEYKIHKQDPAAGKYTLSWSRRPAGSAK